MARTSANGSVRLSPGEIANGARVVSGGKIVYDPVPQKPVPQAAPKPAPVVAKPIQTPGTTSPAPPQQGSNSGGASNGQTFNNPVLSIPGSPLNVPTGGGNSGQTIQNPKPAITPITAPSLNADAVQNRVNQQVQQIKNPQLPVNPLAGLAQPQASSPYGVTYSDVMKGLNENKSADGTIAQNWLDAQQAAQSGMKYIQDKDDPTKQHMIVAPDAYDRVMAAYNGGGPQFIQGGAPQGYVGGNRLATPQQQAAGISAYQGMVPEGHAISGTGMPYRPEAIGLMPLPPGTWADNAGRIYTMDGQPIGGNVGMPGDQYFNGYTGPASGGGGGQQGSAPSVGGSQGMPQQPQLPAPGPAPVNQGLGNLQDDFEAILQQFMGANQQQAADPNYQLSADPQDMIARLMRELGFM